LALVLKDMLCPCGTPSDIALSVSTDALRPSRPAADCTYVLWTVGSLTLNSFLSYDRNVKIYLHDMTKLIQKFYKFEEINPYWVEQKSTVRYLQVIFADLSREPKALF
ncbi:MAG: hypothetical protein AAFO76_14130, partial [Cyanobacteria bacterium J06607_15]